MNNVVQGLFPNAVGDRVLKEILEVFERNGEKLSLPHAIGILEIVKHQIITMNIYEDEEEL